MTVTAENRLTTKLIKRLRDHYGAVAQKIHGSQHQNRGEPDIDGCCRGRSLKIEVKIEGKVPTPIQAKRLREWHKVGALAGWVTSVEELDALVAHVDDPDWRNPQADDGFTGSGEPWIDTPARRTQ